MPSNRLSIQNELSGGFLDFLSHNALLGHFFLTYWCFVTILYFLILCFYVLFGRGCLFCMCLFVSFSWFFNVFFLENSGVFALLFSSSPVCFLKREWEGRQRGGQVGRWRGSGKEKCIRLECIVQIFYSKN